jgi:hypothetical protein
MNPDYLHEDSLFLGCFAAPLIQKKISPRDGFFPHLLDFNTGRLKKDITEEKNLP